VSYIESLDRHRSPAIVMPALCFCIVLTVSVERGSEFSFLNMGPDSVSIPSLIEYAYAPCVGVL
jgi:hypothetical protein